MFLKINLKNKILAYITDYFVCNLHFEDKMSFLGFEQGFKIFFVPFQLGLYNSSIRKPRKYKSSGNEHYDVKYKIRNVSIHLFKRGLDY